MSTPLHWIGQTVRDLLLVVPLPVVRGLFVALPLVLLIWVMRLPPEETLPAEPTGRWSENLKLGAGIALGIQILIYALL